MHCRATLAAPHTARPNPVTPGPRTTLPTLPISPLLEAIGHSLGTRPELVLEAPPGAGKTTLVPLSLLHEPWLAGQRILMLEPRRMAARAAAERMASLLGEQAGATVGYRVRLEARVSANTRIEVITEGILNRMLQDDPSLAGIGLLIFDEFHERSLDADLGLALALAGRALFRTAEDPLRLLVMSATLDGEAVAKVLGDAPVLRAEGRCFPVSLHYAATTPGRDELLPALTAILRRLLAEPPEHTGDILVFLPGQGEIERMIALLTPPAGTVVLPLHGQLALAEQQRVMAPAAQGTRRIVLATNIAETSLTIEGVATVVDAGLAREPHYDPATGLTRLRTRRISRASAEQRAGRAGRLRAGSCHRLWTETEHRSLAAARSPEIRQADLAPLALALLAWGVADPAELHWLDAPPAGAWSELSRCSRSPEPSRRDRAGVVRSVHWASAWRRCRCTRVSRGCCSAPQATQKSMRPARSQPCSPSVRQAGAVAPISRLCWRCCSAVATARRRTVDGYSGRADRHRCTAAT